MKKIVKSKITSRLIFSFSLLILIFCLFGIYSLYEFNAVSDLTRTIYDHPLVVSNAAIQSNVSITKMHRNMKDVVLFKSARRIQQSLDAVDRQEKEVFQNLDIVRDNILGADGKNLENDARTLFTNWGPIRKEVISLVRKGKRYEAAEITIGKGADHVVKLEGKMVELTNYARTKATSFMRKAEKTHSRLYVLSVIFLALAISASSMIAFFTLKVTGSAEKELRESRQLLVNAIDYAPIGMVMVEPDGKFYRLNKAFCEMTGYSEKELFEKGLNTIIHPDDYNSWSDTINQIVKGEIDRATLEKKYLKKDGDTIDIFLSVSLLRDPAGSPLYFFAQVQDISNRKLAEERLRESEEKLSALFSSMTEMVVMHELVFDDEGKPVDYRITNCNDAFTKITGITINDAVGKLATEVYQQPVPPYFEEFCKVNPFR